MRPLRFSINVSLDGCVHHEVGVPCEQLYENVVASFARADVLLFGRVTYQMMEAAWRGPARPAVTQPWQVPFAERIDAMKKVVVSSTLEHADWNGEVVRGDLGDAVRKLKEAPGEGIFLGGTKLALALADLRLIDEYQFLVHPVVAGHGPTLFAGLRERLALKLVDREEFRSGTVVLRYVPR